MRKPSPMQEFRAALAFALGLAVTCFGVAILLFLLLTLSSNR